jgi:sugar O-acyltransferase (sialic acid O-acetyltransferase NeuD family)
MNKVVLIGYSGHSYVIAEILQLSGYSIAGYCEKSQMGYNPFDLNYLGYETDINIVQNFIGSNYKFFPAIGDNKIRERVTLYLQNLDLKPLNAIHPDSSISLKSSLGDGVMISSGVRINPLSIINDGTIINTGAIIEHECKIGQFSHIAPGAVLAGNVSIGARSFIGANAVIKEGIIIGSDVIVGAGAVVICNVQDGITVVGNPAIPKK